MLCLQYQICETLLHEPPVHERHLHIAGFQKQPRSVRKRLKLHLQDYILQSQTLLGEAVVGVVEVQVVGKQSAQVILEGEFREV